MPSHSSPESIDPSQKSHNTSDKYPTMYHFVTEICTHVHISVTKWCIVRYGTGALWDLCSQSIFRTITQRCASNINHNELVIKVTQEIELLIDHRSHITERQKR